MSAGTVGSAKREQVILLRIAGASVSEISQNMGISPGVISRTLRLPEVQSQIKWAQEEARSLASQRLTALAMEAVETLREIALGRPDAAGTAPPANVRRLAAVDLLDRAYLMKGHSVRAAGLAIPNSFQEDWEEGVFGPPNED